MVKLSGYKNLNKKVNNKIFNLLFLIVVYSNDHLVLLIRPPLSVQYILEIFHENKKRLNCLGLKDITHIVVGRWEVKEFPDVKYNVLWLDFLETNGALLI